MQISDEVPELGRRYPPLELIQKNAIEREPLFPDEKEDDLLPIINTMDVTQKIRSIRRLERQVEQYELQERESREFYARKKQQCAERMDYIKRNILGFLQQNDMKNIQTPAGTAYQKSVTLKTWPSDDTLVAWATAHLPAAVRSKTEPDRKLISAHIKETGQAPDGFSETTETRLYLK